MDHREEKARPQDLGGPHALSHVICGLLAFAAVERGASEDPWLGGLGEIVCVPRSLCHLEAQMSATSELALERQEACPRGPPGLEEHSHCGRAERMLDSFGLVWCFSQSGLHRNLIFVGKARVCQDL